MGCSLLVLLPLFVLLSPSRELQFLEKYGRLKEKWDPYTPKSLLFGRKDGWRIYTDRAELEEVIQDLQKNLPTWKMKRFQDGAAFVGDQETLTVRRGRSMYIPDPYYKYKGQPIYGRFVVTEQYAKKHFGLDPAVATGWISIDHEWMPRSGWLDDLFKKPGGTGPIPANPAAKPRP